MASSLFLLAVTVTAADNGPCFRGGTYRAIIGDGNALAVEINQFRHTYNTLPHQALDDRTPRQAYLTSRESQ
ncbi:hypothetical protein [Streptomyces yerevanensis]|uniref:hypothetical protein n=1 Tax=Streptomyces yerevanensis TaxID=66378 RepID=UPI000B22EBEF|nr:hypothetical protein [Streptomyces yerevanensis]